MKENARVSGKRKGGVGKSSLIASLAVLLSKAGVKAMVVYSSPRQSSSK